MHMSKVLQYVEETKTRAAAETTVQHMRALDGVIAARVIGDGRSKPFAAQMFMGAEEWHQLGDIGAGFRCVLCPSHILTG